MNHSVNQERGRYNNRISRDQRGHRDMRPGKRVEVEENCLAILDLDKRHNNLLWCNYVHWRCERESRPKATPCARRGLNRDWQSICLANWNHNRFKDRFDPEDRLHLECVSVRILRGCVAVPRQKRDLRWTSRETRS